MVSASSDVVSRGSFAPIISSHVRSYPLDDDLIIFDDRRARLFALNSTASLVWRLLNAGNGIDEVAAVLSEEAAVAPDRAAKDVGRLLEQWRQAGLIGSADAGAEESDARESSPAQLNERGRRGTRFERSAGAPTFSRAFRLMDGGIRVTGDADLAGIVDSLFGPLAVPIDAADPAWPMLEVFKTADRWIVAFDGMLLGDCRERREVAPLVYGSTSALVYHASKCFAVVHASAVARGGSAVLMPGLPGNGKSTLAAALVANGYEYCADDLAILSVRSSSGGAASSRDSGSQKLRLRPLRFPIGLKSGSWPVLHDFWPKLAELPTYRRADGRFVKYLPPPLPEGHASPDRGLTVTAMVFPKFSPGSNAQLQPLARSAALARMTEAGYDLPGKLDDGFVRILVEWFEGLSCYELHFDDLDEAVRAYSGVFA